MVGIYHIQDSRKFSLGKIFALFAVILLSWIKLFLFFCPVLQPKVIFTTWTNYLFCEFLIQYKGRYIGDLKFMSSENFRLYHVQLWLCYLKWIQE